MNLQNIVSMFCRCDLSLSESQILAVLEDEDINTVSLLLILSGKIKRNFKIDILNFQ